MLYKEVSDDQTLMQSTQYDTSVQHGASAELLIGAANAVGCQIQQRRLLGYHQ